MAQRFVIEQTDDGKWMAGPENEPQETAGGQPPAQGGMPMNAAPGQGALPPGAAEMLGGASQEAQGGLHPVESLDEAIEVARAYFGTDSDAAQEAEAGLQRGYAKAKGPGPSMMM